MTDEQHQEILNWLRIAAAPALLALLERHIEDETDWIVYEESDGTRNREAVGALADITGRSVGNRWKAWREIGLIIDAPGSPHPRHIASATSLKFSRPGSQQPESLESA